MLELQDVTFSLLTKEYSGLIMTEQPVEKLKKKYFAITQKKILICTFGVLLIISAGKLVIYEILAVGELRSRLGQRIVLPTDLSINAPAVLPSGRYSTLRNMSYRFSGDLGFFELELCCDIAVAGDNSVREFVVGLSPREALEVLIYTNKTAGMKLDYLTNKKEHSER